MAVAADRKRAPEPEVAVRCPGCGCGRLVSRSWARRMPSLCADCRDPERARLQREEFRRYWLARFSRDEIEEMARAIWG